MPWLHTVTVAVKDCHDLTLAGPLTPVTTRSARSPTPSRPPTWTLLSSRASCSTPSVSTAAAR
ncbi:hypothetical protein F0U60_31920 [Archangium minus]|uniref:Uncharacterized protein n=1 Tax=Archangium minus TaxID=83450 RepID=A0ABY9WYK5_9BACT|nr:hypothetical protein F0U60_31920 [Archangium minus]